MVLFDLTFPVLKSLPFTLRSWVYDSDVVLFDSTAVINGGGDRLGVGARGGFPGGLARWGQSTRRSGEGASNSLGMYRTAMEFLSGGRSQQNRSRQECEIGGQENTARSECGRGHGGPFLSLSPTLRMLSTGGDMI